jgi:hypothetical protein
MTANVTKKNSEAQLTQRILELLRDGVEAIFASLGFHVARTSFPNVISDPLIRNLINKSYKNTEIAKQLLYFPDFFVMHPKKDPLEGVMFILCLVQATSSKPDKPIAIELERIRTYTKFFPCNKIIVIMSQPHIPTVVAGWFSKCFNLKALERNGLLKVNVGKMSSLKVFIHTELKMDVNDELLRRFDEELKKVYGKLFNDVS